MGNPTITCSVRDINETTKKLTGNDQILIRNWSIAKATMSAKAYDGASIDMDLCLIKNGTKTAFGTTAEFLKPVSNVFVFSVADSKGRTAQATATPSMVNYITPTCNSNNDRIDTNGKITLTCYGEFFNGSFGAKTNSLTVKCKYKPDGGSWSGEYSMTVTESGNTYTASKSFTGLDNKKSYEFQFRVTDLLSEAAAETGNLSSLPVFHWGKEDVTFEVPVTFEQETFFREAPEFDCDLQITGNLRLKGSDNYGNTLYFGDGGYCTISEPEDDVMQIKADTINFVVEDGLQLNGKSGTLPEYGDWYPQLYDSAVDEYTARRGWYTKVGDIVTVGFYIKADCRTGYEGYIVKIAGLPYTAGREASGGGICSGVYMRKHKTFQCYAVEEGTKDITLRVQDCDRDYDEDISTSASGCYYSEDGGAITLSGTITYTVSE